MKKYSVSAIVPAFGKERRIQETLQALYASSSISEIICMYDGDDYETLKIIRSFKDVKLYKSLRRRGKAYACAEGIEKSKGDIIFFVDADISGFTPQIIEQFFEPLWSGSYDCVVGYRCSRVESTFGVPIGGERAYFKKDLLPHVEYLKKRRGYIQEIYFNYQFRNKRIKIFRMKGVYSFAKKEKYQRLTAYRMHLWETYEVLEEILRRKNFASYFVYSYLNYMHFKDRRIGDFLSPAYMIERILPE